MGYTGVSVSRSDYVRMPVEFHVEIATLFPSALSLFLFLFIFIFLSSAGAGNPTSSYDDGNAENNEVSALRKIAARHFENPVGS